MANYCSKCGKQLEDGVRYCPVCGFDTMNQGSSGSQGGGYDQNYNQQNNNTQHSDFSNGGMGGTLTIIFILGILWAIIAILAGIFMAAFGGVVIFYGGALAIIAGILCLVSGLFALLSCINIYKLEKHKDACTYCLIGSVLAIFCGGIITGIIGLVFYFLLNKEGYRFKS